MTICQHPVDKTTETFFFAGKLTVRKLPNQRTQTDRGNFKTHPAVSMRYKRVSSSKYYIIEYVFT